MSAPKSSLVTLVRRLDIRPAEVVALALLLCGALLAVALLWWLHRPTPVASAGPPGVDATVTEAPAGLQISSGEVIVHVAGAVRRPGVYTLPGGSRVGEAVTAAGGATRRAVLDGLNLARVVTDGEQVLVPDKRAQTSAAAGGAPGGATTSTPGAKLSLNQATAADFETLPGIGPVLASRILEYRDSIGGFKEVGELRDVPGIGEKTFQALADLVTV